MIRITLKIGIGLCGIKNTRIEEMDIDEGILVSDFLLMLSKTLGEDLLKPTVMVVLNGTKLMENEKKIRVLKSGDNVSIFGALAGG